MDIFIFGCWKFGTQFWFGQFELLFRNFVCLTWLWWSLVWSEGQTPFRIVKVGLKSCDPRKHVDAIEIIRR